MHIYKNPKNQEEKKYNSETLSLAKGVKSKREVQLRNKEFGFKDNVNISIDLVGFYKRIVDDYYNNGSKSNYSSWKSSLNHFENFCSYAITTSQLDIEFVKYAQSSQVRSIRESSVSYASATARQKSTK